VFEWLRPDVELVTDLSPANWFRATLAPWPPRAGGRIRLASYMPDGFESYVRILHPFYKTVYPTPTTYHRWSEVAAIRGVQIEAETSAVNVAGDEWRAVGGYYLPDEGAMPEEACAALVRVLGDETRTPTTCWFALWSGWGDLRGGPGLVPTIPGPTPEEQRETRRQQRREEAALDAIPQISLWPHTGGRQYLLFRGPTDAACSFDTGHGWHVPSFWWPDDRSWAVVTDIDATSTYVGGARSTIDAILGAGDFEALEVGRDARLG
jgi:hypothetical protein